MCTCLHVGAWDSRVSSTGYLLPRNWRQLFQAPHFASKSLFRVSSPARCLSCEPPNGCWESNFKPPPCLMASLGMLRFLPDGLRDIFPLPAQPGFARAACQQQLRADSSGARQAGEVSGTPEPTRHAQSFRPPVRPQHEGSQRRSGSPTNRTLHFGRSMFRAPPMPLWCKEAWRGGFTHQCAARASLPIPRSIAVSRRGAARHCTVGGGDVVFPSLEYTNYCRGNAISYLAMTRFDNRRTALMLSLP